VHNVECIFIAMKQEKGKRDIQEELQ